MSARFSVPRTWVIVLTMVAMVGGVLTASSAFASSHDNALDFDGVNDVVVTDPITSGLAATVELWVKPDTGARSQIYNGGIEYKAAMSINADGKWQARVFTTCNFGCRNLGVVVGGPAQIGQWTHLAYVYELGEVGEAELFVNGVSAGTTPVFLRPQFGESAAAALTARTDVPHTIGGRLNDNHFNGQIDEFRIWDVARTADEINATRSCGLTGSEIGLEAYYTFNQGVAGGSNTTETTLFDSTPNGNDATLVAGRFALNGPSSNWVASSSEVANNGLCPADDQIDNLGAAVDGLLDSGDLTADQAEDLTLKLDAAIEKLNEGKPDKAIKKLEDFISKVNRWVDRDKVESDVGADLIAAAQAVIDSIESG